jgi:hypothetical protein
MPGADNGRWSWSTRPITDGPIRRVDVGFSVEDRETLELMCLHEDQTASGLIRELLFRHAAELDQRMPNWRATATSRRAGATKSAKPT